MVTRYTEEEKKAKIAALKYDTLKEGHLFKITGHEQEVLILLKQVDSCGNTIYPGVFIDKVDSENILSKDFLFFDESGNGINYAITLDLRTAHILSFAYLDEAAIIMEKINNVNKRHAEKPLTMTEKHQYYDEVLAPYYNSNGQQVPAHLEPDFFEGWK